MMWMALIGLTLVGGAVILAGDDDDSTASDIDVGSNTEGGSQTGTAGPDLLFCSDGNDQIDGAAGNDSIGGYGGNDLLDGGTGNDLLDGGAGNDTLTGGEGIDSLYGDSGDDTLQGEAKADFLAGEGGDDRLAGGDGQDLLHGGSGDDTLNASLGNDFLLAVEGDDVLNGGYGNDGLQGGEGADTLNGGAGNDMVNGGSVLAASDGSNYFAEDVFDDLQAGLAPNSIGSSFDRIYDYKTADELNGGEGHDTLIGGVDDTLTGGDGQDVFTTGDWLDGDGHATVTDFDTDDDMIVYRYDETSAPPNLELFSLAQPDGSTDAEIRANGVTVLVIQNVADDFEISSHVAMVAAPMA